MRLPALPWPESIYQFDVPRLSSESLARIATDLFARVWRTALDEPGFALIRLVAAPASLDLRKAMLDLAEVMPERFIPERLGRFDQQGTSRFHRDGAPPRSLLILGYEPSPVASRLFIADAHRAAWEAGLAIDRFLAAFNPMLAEGEAKLGPYVTELAIRSQEPVIVVINNSLVPFEPGSMNPLGVLHRAEVPNPNPSAVRVINSIGLMPADTPDWKPKDVASIRHFLTRQDLD
jgi:hypothetical protein